MWNGRVAKVRKRKEAMVLRTVYLPISLDDELRRLAYDEDVSKGELIRESVQAMVESRSEDGKPAKDD